LRFRNILLAELVSKQVSIKVAREGFGIIDPLEACFTIEWFYPIRKQADNRAMSTTTGAQG